MSDELKLVSGKVERLRPVVEREEHRHGDSFFAVMKPEENGEFVRHAEFEKLRQYLRATLVGRDMEREVFAKTLKEMVSKGVLP